MARVKAQPISAAAYVRSVLQGVDKDSDCLGVDPDCHNTAFAVVRNNKLKSVSCTRVSRKIKGQRCAPYIYAGTKARTIRSRLCPPLVCAIEGQTIRRGAGHETKNALSIVQLAICAGAALGGILANAPDCNIMVVDPVTWKGSIHKQIHQVRILKRLGWAYELVGNAKTGYARPCNPDNYRHICGAENLRKGDWKHVMDAIGIALWLSDQLRDEVRLRETP